MTSPYTLYIGDPAYSSWSMRPFLALERAEIGFDTQLVRLDTPDTRDALTRLSPARTVPVLKSDRVVLWDSLAICEWVAEASPAGLLWPQDAGARALARSGSASMHAGFHQLRRAFPMNLHRHRQPRREDAADAMTAADELVALWSFMLAQSGGPFLAGPWSIADAMATPYATRFVSYDLPVPGLVAAYIDRVLTTPEYEAWAALAAADELRKPDVDAL